VIYLVKISFLNHEKVSEISKIKMLKNDGVFRSLEYSLDFSKQAEQLLFQLPPELLTRLDKEKDLKILFKGTQDEDLVVCTESETFDVKFSDTSNSLLVISPCDDGENFQSLSILRVEKIMNKHIEMRKSFPRLRKLKQLLSQNLYNGIFESEFKKYTFEELLLNVQASEQEILKELQKLNALHLDGYWRLLSEEYRRKVYDLVMAALLEDDINPHRFSCQQIYNSLEAHNISVSVLFHCLKTISDPINSDNCIQENIYFQINWSKVSQLKGLELLKINPLWEIQNFISHWKEILMSEDDVDFSLLKGNYITFEKSTQKFVQYFPEHELSINPKERMEQLFAAKTTWLFQEIEPFLCELADNNGNVDYIFTKYSRSFIKNGLKYYKARH
jgi:sister chromatid cohesion protein DCC1